MATRRKRIGSSTTINKLADDEELFVEIFIRLPDPKSAVQCKSVCKRWNSLLSDPYFPRRFLSHHHTSVAGEPDPPPLLTPSELRELILSFLPLPPPIESKFSVLDSAKDLVLLGFPREENGDELYTTYLVCNPFTKQWVALPLAPKESARCCSIVKLVCQPCRNIPPGLEYLAGGGGSEGAVIPSSRHLGYHRFRVVRIGMEKWWLPASTMPVEVFCSRSGRWTELLLCTDDSLRCSSDYGARVLSLDENLYWLNEQQQVVKLNPFNLNHSTVPTLLHGSDMLLRPNRPLHEHFRYRFHCYVDGPWASNGGLYLITGNYFSSFGLTLWRLEEQQGIMGWKIRYEVISLEDLGCIGASCESDTLGWRFDYRVIGMHSEKSEIVFLCRYHSQSKQYAILSCDFKKMELELLAYWDMKSKYCSTYKEEDVFQSKVTYWPSAIPDYEQLRNAYSESYDCWLQPSNQPTS